MSNENDKKQEQFGMSQERRDKNREIMATKNMVSLPDLSDKEGNKRKAKALKELLG